jgi:hypothetical protein
LKSAFGAAEATAQQRRALSLRVLLRLGGAAGLQFSAGLGEQDEVAFEGCIIPDHIPQMLGGYCPGLAYSIAYLRALVEAVNNEFGGPSYAVGFYSALACKFLLLPSQSTPCCA